MAEYLARVNWPSILEYRKELGRTQGPLEGSRRLPLTDQYGSDQLALDKLEFGDGLWLFTAPVFGKGTRRRTLPPSVLGRISITHRWKENAEEMEPAPGAPRGFPPTRDTSPLDVSVYKYWRCGKPGKALPIHNAFALFKKLTFKGRVKSVNPKCKGCNRSNVPERGPFGHLMQHFEAIRELTDVSANHLADLHDHVKQHRTLFLSHRRVEAGPLVKEVAEYLRNDALCWWDVQALPQSLDYDDSVLRDMLNDGVRQAGWFIAFLTPNYREGWAYDEWQAVRRLGAERGRARKPKTLPVLLGSRPLEGMEGQPPIDLGRDAKKIASAIRERIKSRRTPGER